MIGGNSQPFAGSYQSVLKPPRNRLGNNEIISFFSQVSVQVIRREGEDRPWRESRGVASTSHLSTLTKHDDMTTSTAFFPCNSDSFIEYYVLVLQKNDSYNYSPHVLSFIFATIISILVFLISTLTGNFSQVDKLWSILPAIYAWVCYASAPINDARIIVMTFLVSAWSIRLTYNFYLRGGYTFPKFWQGDEDYRWEVLRSGGGGGNKSNFLLQGTPLIYLSNNKYSLQI